MLYWIDLPGRNANCHGLIILERIGLNISANSFDMIF